MLTNISFGEQKRQALLKGFGIDTSEEQILQKSMAIANKMGLTLKEITDKNGKKSHRWVNGQDEEHAEHGSHVTFQHDGKTVTGQVGRVSKSSGRYIVKDSSGNEYKKHAHEVQKAGTNVNHVDHDDDKSKPKSQLHSFANQKSDDDLQDYIDKNTDSDDPQVQQAVKAASDVLKGRKTAGGANAPAKPAKAQKQAANASTDDDDDDAQPAKPAAKAQKAAKAADDDDDDANITGIAAKPVKSAQDIQDEADQQAHEDINERFDDFADYVTGVVHGMKKSAIMYGSGGVGKTWTTTQTLKDMGLKFYDEEQGHAPGDDTYDVATIEGGKVTPTGFYKAMWEHNGKVLVFDDCDSALEHPDIKGFLKGALGSSQSTVTNATNGSLKDSNGNAIPKQFKFTGKMIFISNLSKKYMMGKDMQPIMSRSFSTDMTMSRKDTLARIKHIATDKGSGKLTNMKFDGMPNYTHEEMEDVLALLDKYKDTAYDLNARTVETLLGMKKLADMRFPNDPAAAKKNFETKAKKNLLQHLDADGNDLTKAVWANLHKAFTTDFQETLAYEKLGFDVTSVYEKTLVEC